MFEALRERNFALYWTALVFYVLGHRAEYVTFAWIVWELTQSPMVLGYLGLAQGIPLLVFQLVGGVVADRVDRRRLLIATQLLTGLTLTGTIALTVAGFADVRLLLALAAVTNTFRAFDEPTRLAMVPQLVDRAQLPNAIALGSIPWQAGRMIGPSITGIVIAAFGSAVGFAIAAGSSWIALALYGRMRLRPEPSTHVRTHVVGEFVEGLAYVGGSFVFATLIGMALLNSIFGMSYLALLPIFADWYFQAGSTGYGLLNAAHGVGALVGTLTIATVASRIRHRGVALLVGGACVGVALVAFAVSPWMGLSLGLLLIVGFCNTFYLTQINTILQEDVPNHLRGRVMSIFSLCWNLMPLGGLVGGALAAAVDARFAVLLGGGVVAATALLLLTSPRLRAIR